ncbi:TIGR02302 family protein [Agrobacterium sp. ES01]|uniref:TIGR02302 family protein n=1 Tax=Agrobacterium sp. ES01 TaxID=3420714 RepID=UPI003D1326A1
MSQPDKHKSRATSAFSAYPRLARLVAVKRFLARLVLFAERAIPLFLPSVGIAAIFLSLAWLGVFRIIPDIPRFGLVFVLIFAFLAALIPFFRLRWPKAQEADRLLEERNNLPHQPVAVQEDVPAFESPFARALWQEHQRRMARKIAALDAGLPRPDISKFDQYALRTIPALLLVTAYAFSGSNNAGRVADAFRWNAPEATVPDMRIDAWITPPSYTGRAPVFLTGRENAMTAAPSVPQFSVATVRLSGGDGSDPVHFIDDSGKTIDLDRQGAKETDSNSTQADAKAARTFTMKIADNGTLEAAGHSWPIEVVLDKPPEIAFDGMPKVAVNGALEIPFKATDDYGLQEAHAEIVPVDEKDGATPLYPLPEYKLDLPRYNAREAKGLASRNITEHPLSGKRVKITLVSTDGAGQTGRSPPHEMILPPHRFTNPLAAAVSEQRQVFALDTRQMPQAIALNEALTVRADETIPNPTHFLLIESARARMKLANNEVQLKDTADYLWEIALGIEDGDLSLAEQRLRDAQKALSEALENNASDEEIAALMDELRSAMQDFLKELAQRQQDGQPMDQQQAMQMMTDRDLNNMMDQIENLARSGNRDAAQQMLNELQRMMNNMQAGRPQQGGQQQKSNNQMREQIDKLGELMQQQQKLMDETFKLDQALRDRMQRGDPDQGEQQQGQQDGQQSPSDQMTAEQLRDALKKLREQQDGLGQQLQELQQALEGMGVKPGEGFGQAQREMKGAGEALGQGKGNRAVEGQGRALEALREGARDMMGQIMQAMRGQGQNPGQGMAGQGQQNGRDPLGRPRATSGPDFGENVRVPDEIDVQRAREILESIRRKLEENASPETEKRYLERLLDIQ